MGERPFGKQRGWLVMITKILAVQHRLNPLHVYCRFVERGYNKRLSLFACKAYERLVFAWISPLIKALIYLCCLKSRSITVQDLLRKR
jgi:hypothetical protein